MQQIEAQNEKIYESISNSRNFLIKIHTSMWKSAEFGWLLLVGSDGLFVLNNTYDLFVPYHSIKKITLANSNVIIHSANFSIQKNNIESIYQKLIKNNNNIQLFVCKENKLLKYKFGIAKSIKDNMLFIEINGKIRKISLSSIDHIIIKNCD